jgi:hypothetical protein
VKKDTVARIEPPLVKTDTAVTLKTEPPPAVVKKDTIARTEPPVVKTDTAVTVKTAPPPAVVKTDTIARTEPPVVKTDTAATVKTAPPPAVVKTDTIARTEPPVVKTDTAATVKTEPPPAVVKTDTIARTEPPIIKADTTATVKTELPPAVVKKDTIARAAPPTPAIVVKNFSFEPAHPHYVAVLLDKVDPVYASEARNAFNRFNKERYYGRRIDMNSVKLDDRFNIVLQGPFKDALAAVEYIDEVKPLAKSRILPWLSAEKYTFIIVSEANLEVLKVDKDMDSYKQLLQKALPGKF